MRAIFFAEYFPPYMGSDRRIFHIARALTQWNVEFAVVPPLRILGGRCEQGLREYFSRYFLNGVVDDESGGIHGHYFRLPRGLASAWRSAGVHAAYAVTLPYLIRAAARYLRARKPDVVVIAHPSYLCGVAGLAAARACGIPALLDYPDAWTPLAVETASLSPWGASARILAGIERAAAHMPDRIVSITAALARYIGGLGARCPIEVVPNGADETHFDFRKTESGRARLGYADDDEIVLYSGRLEPWSGVDEIVRMVGLTARMRPRVKFLFVGDGSAAARAAKDIHEARLEQHAAFIGYRPYGQMPSLIAAADIAIVPFPRTPTTEVCSPLKLFEYMMMHKPVITTGLPGLRELVSDEHAFFIHTFRAEEQANAVVLLLESAGLRSRLAESSYALVRRYLTWTTLAERFSRAMLATVAARRSA